MFFIAGFHCPAGSSSPIACAAGTYAQTEGKASCDNCPQGFYCPLNTTNPESCPMGYICRPSQGSAFEVPCPVGKFNNLTERYQDADCLDCPAGYVSCVSSFLTLSKTSPGFYVSAVQVFRKD